VVIPLLLPLIAATVQLPEAEAAFRRGDQRAARASYEAVLRQDSANVRALYRLAVLDSWDGKLQRSLDRFVRLRRLEPADPDIMVAQARVLAWAGKTGAAEQLYDSVLAIAPARSDALAGRARAVAWAGDLDRAERLWRSALEVHPEDAEILVGLAQTLFWRGKPELAESYVSRARQLAPDEREARDLLSLVRAARRPGIATASSYAHDSDDNAFFAQDGSITGSLGRDLRGTLQVGWRRATDPARTGLSYGAGGYVIAPLGRGAVLRAGLGIRRLAPDGGTARSPLTAQVGIGLRPARFAALSLAYSRTPFDETALLIDSGYVMDGVDLSFDATPRPGLSISGGGGLAWLSDAVSNRRAGGVLAVMTTPWRGIELGVLGRMMGYRIPNPGAGYFAPNRFGVLEARVTGTWRRERWGIRTDGGVGTQQVGTGAPMQAEWHVGLGVTRGWSANNELTLTGSLTNSAAIRSGTATAAGFRYGTISLRVQQGL
jgi:tetratricopeptide (TPR) repeat protein